MSRGGMTAAPDLSGVTLGRYEITTRLGSGGMGDVYRALDTRLRREVALKVLCREDAGRDSLRRFETEARMVSSLDHPNIVTIFDVGTSGSVSYIAMELIEGRTLRELLQKGPMRLEKTLAIAAQITRALAGAHSAGVVHRDVKPENVMVTRAGDVKILDFGVAKRSLAALESGSGSTQPTVPLGTSPGVVLGTIRYMSPEQAAGRPVDFRTDQFSFGSVLYEMLTGRRAFAGDTGVDTLSAILHSEPPALSVADSRISPQIRWCLQRCLSKDPAGRFACTEDLAREVAAARDRVSETAAEDSRRVEIRRLLPWLLIAAAAGAAVVFFAAGLIRPSPEPGATFRQITFRNESISSARFAPDGHTIVYASAREGHGAEMFSTRVETPGSQLLGIARAEVLSISGSAQMAIMIDREAGVRVQSIHRDSTFRDPRLALGTIAVVPMTGGAPREVVDDGFDADWDPAGEKLAVIRYAAGRNRLEFPPGRLLYETDGWLARPRVSPDGSEVAVRQLDELIVVGMDKKVRSLAHGATEIVWPRPGRDIWFNRVLRGATEIRTVRTDGTSRSVASLPGDFALEDIAEDRTVLLARSVETTEVLGDFVGDSRPRDLSWLDRSVAVDLSSDGRWLLLNEKGQGTKRVGEIYLRRTDGSPAKFLGEGVATSLSPDGRFVLAAPEAGDSLLLLPTGAGEKKVVDVRPLSPAGRALFFPDSRRILFMGRTGRSRRAYVKDLAGGPPRAVTPEGVRRPLLSRDGRVVASIFPDGQWHLSSIDSTVPPTRVLGLEPGEEPMQWAAGDWLYVLGANRLPADGSEFVTRVYRLNPRTGERSSWKSIPPVTPSSGGGVSTILFSEDGKSCVYTHDRFSAELYVAHGWM